MMALSARAAAVLCVCDAGDCFAVAAAAAALLSVLILLCIAWGVYLYHYEDIYGEKPYFRER